MMVKSDLCVKAADHFSQVNFSMMLQYIKYDRKLPLQKNECSKDVSQTIWAWEPSSSHNTDVDTNGFFLMSLQEYAKPNRKAAHLTTTQNNLVYVKASAYGLHTAVRFGPQ